MPSLPTSVLSMKNSEELEELLILSDVGVQVAEPIRRTTL